MLAVIVCIIAGILAGLGTGFAGMSAAAVISPMLTVCLKVDSYEAITIALASDVLASGVSAIFYAKNKNIDIKNGLIMMIFILIFTFVGSYISSFVERGTMGIFSLAMTIILGLRFIIKPVNKTKEERLIGENKHIILKSIVCGVYIGFVCGFIGAGGGLMMLLVLTTVLGYDLKSAVGTSVFIMTFTALTGAVSHFVINNFVVNYKYLIICAIFTLIFAQVASLIANKVSNKKLNLMTGIILMVTGICLIIIKLLQ